MDLTDEQWADGKGRPRVGNRAIFNGILWVMRTGAPWHDMSKSCNSGCCGFLVTKVIAGPT
jgi:transposase